MFVRHRPRARKRKDAASSAPLVPITLENTDTASNNDKPLETVSRIGLARQTKSMPTQLERSKEGKRLTASKQPKSSEKTKQTNKPAALVWKAEKTFPKEVRFSNQSHGLPARRRYETSSGPRSLAVPRVSRRRALRDTCDVGVSMTGEEAFVCRPTEKISVHDERLRDLISSKFDHLISSIDGESFAGDEQGLVIQEEPHLALRGGWASATQGDLPKGADRGVNTTALHTNYFARAKLYTNSRLPSNLPPLQLYMPAYPLLCLAARYSQRAYDKPSGQEREAFVKADWRMGTKAMVLKSVPIDDMNCIVFAIRGSQTFMDWAVNLHSAPVAPANFLDDIGNLCHSGFLSVARKMVKPVAARLRALLEEDPSRKDCSLLMTGHSAGGAVASLLYAHMLAEDLRSELNILTGCFKRIHCLTFGTPPVSLLPLTKPPIPRHKKSLFMTLINEGDPVPRADKAYVRSLLSLYISPTPGAMHSRAKFSALNPFKGQSMKNTKNTISVTTNPVASDDRRWKWDVPPGTLSNAGRLVILREMESTDRNAIGDIQAAITSDQQLREVVFGDPIMHMMSVYAQRVESIATKAVTATIRG